jgi:ribosomal protein S18 acetylase RimI-like enzyme
MDILPVNAEDKVERQKIIAFLSQHESQTLFLLGNFLNPTQPSYLYKSIEEGILTGVCGYYPTFRSSSLFATNAEAGKALALHVFAQHTSLSLLGMAKVVEPAYIALVASGKNPVGSPDYPFFELDIEHQFIPHKASKGTIRLMRETDVESVVRLNRYLHHLPQDPPYTEEEIAQVRAFNILFCLEVEGRVVAIAASNGLAITVFQILGVVTDPAFQNQGFAKAICSHLISFMRAQGAKKAVLFTKDDNAPAIKCYQDLGFRITDRFYVAQFQS